MLYVIDETHLSYRAYFIGGILYMAEEKKKGKMIGSYDIKVPEDTDVLLGYDVTANKVKNFKFSGIWTWLISKLKGSSISDLNTTNKTVVGAIKEVNTPTFTTATSRTNINSGESQSIIMGKIKKWLADLGTAAFCSVVNNLTTTAEGSVLDARQGKNLSDALTKLNTLMGSTDISAIGGGTLTGAISELNSKPLKYLRQPENIPDGMNIDLFSASCGKSGGNITIAFNVRGSIEITKTFLTLITLPKEYVPSRNLYESYITQEGYTMLLQILSTGEVQVYSNSAIKSAFFLRKIISY